MSSTGSGSVTTPVAASAISGHVDTRTAATEAAGDLYDHIGASPDLVVLFASYQHRAALPEAAATFRSTLRPRTLLGVTAEAVLGVDQELDGVSGLSAIAMRLPGARLHPFAYEAQRHAGLMRDPEAMRRHLGVDDQTRAILLLADPFSTPISRLLPAFAGCRGEAAGAGAIAVAGGMASGASQAGNNMLVLDGATLKAGAVGATISGAVAIDIVVSQGCRPIGRPLVVTRCKGNVIQELGARPAIEALHAQVEGLSAADRALTSAGVLLGTVIDEYKDRFGRGDFLVRSILGLDQQKQAIAVGDTPRVGQTVQFHVRDADTAHEDLQLLLDAQQLKEAPLGAMLFTCNGRGARLFKDGRNDVQTIRDRLGDLPLAGFFAAGEIGPIGGRCFVHGHTAALALIRTASA